MAGDSRRNPQYDEQGLNVGAWPEIAADQLITPADRFFRRSHAPAPHLDPATWRLRVGGLVERAATYTLDDLETRFPRREIEATVVCAGLRRAELLALGPLPGEVPWGPDAASTGRWTGVRLADVLRAAGLSDAAQHVELVGLDRVERRGQRFGFGGSIELDKALSEEVTLATHMNGEPLRPDHGFPLRAVVPGWIGARSVKWLGEIIVRADPSGNYFQTHAYRIQRHLDPANPQSVVAGEAMREVPLNAVILEPPPGSAVAAGPVTVRGWAIGSECRPLHSIEVSANRGVDWVSAKVLSDESPWAWTFWESVIELEPGAHVLMARAADETGAMPATVQETWNVKGYGNNAWYRVEVTAR